MTDETNQTPAAANSYEIRAAQILSTLEHQKTFEDAQQNPTPESQDETRTLVHDIRNALYRPVENDEIKRLEHQAKILDIAFRRLMIDADTTYKNTDRVDCDPMKYAAAFKAQDQYRRTVKTLKLLKTKAKIRKTRGKRP